MMRRALSLLVVAALATPALAGDKPEKKGEKNWEKEWEHLLKRVDKDGDGQVSKAELEAAKAEHEKKQAENPEQPKNPGQPKAAGKHHGGHPLLKHFDDIDTNKDGKISKDEFKAFIEKLREKAQEKKAEKKAEQPKPEQPKADEPKAADPK